MPEPSTGSDTAARPRHHATWIVTGLLGAWFAFSVLTSATARQPINCDVDLEPDRDTVVMLSASWCGYCRRAREYLHENRIQHCEYDVERSAEGRARFAALPVRVVPVITLRDDTFVGFNPTEIQQSLMAHGLVEFN